MVVVVGVMHATSRLQSRVVVLASSTICRGVSIVLRAEPVPSLLLHPIEVVVVLEATPIEEVFEELSPQVSKKVSAAENLNLKKLVRSSI